MIQVSSLLNGENRVPLQKYIVISYIQCMVVVNLTKIMESFEIEAIESSWDGYARLDRRIWTEIKL